MTHFPFLREEEVSVQEKPHPLHRARLTCVLPHRLDINTLQLTTRVCSYSLLPRVDTAQDSGTEVKATVASERYCHAGERTKLQREQIPGKGCEEVVMSTENISFLP